MGDSIFDAQAVTPSLVEHLPIMRAAKEVEPDNLRAAYLCRFYAFEKVHRLDQTSSGRGVRHFKISLLQKLERDNVTTLIAREEKSDALAINQCYLHYYDNFIKALQDAVDKADRDLLAELFQTEAVLFEVLKAVTRQHSLEVDQAVLEMHRKIEQYREMYAPDIMPPSPPLSPSKLATWDEWQSILQWKPEEISGGEGLNDSSTSDYKGLIDGSRDRMNIKCVIPNVLDQIIQDETAEPISIPLALLLDITDKFADERKIGQGGFGVVYKGVLQNGNVAVKKLLNSQTIDDELFYRETNFLMSVKHQNIVRFLGYCATTENIALKWTDRENVGSICIRRLEKDCSVLNISVKGAFTIILLDELRGLDWRTRYQTIKRICDGLQYLHMEKDIVHMDLKPDNILMDDLMIPKITDFGYCAPEYLHRGQLSFKSDIFSLGVIIIDLVTGRKEDPDIKNVLRRWRHRRNRSAKYPSLGYQQVTGCIEIAARCVSHDPKERPYISDIICQLDELDYTNGHDDDANESIFSLINPYPWDIDPLERHFPFEVDK